jgi:hypothetical protein
VDFIENSHSRSIGRLWLSGTSSSSGLHRGGCISRSFIHFVVLDESARRVCDGNWHGMEYMLRYADVLCVDHSVCGSSPSTVLATLESSPAKVDFIIILLVSCSLCLREIVCLRTQRDSFRLLLHSATSISFSFVGFSSPPCVIECMHACARYKSVPTYHLYSLLFCTLLTSPILSLPSPRDPTAR